MGSEALVLYLSSLHPSIPLIMSVLGGLVILGQVYVAITPGKEDDAWWAKIESKKMIGPLFKALKSFAPIQRKDKDK